MIRRPTSTEQAFYWWREAISGRNAPITEMDVHCGYFKTRAWQRGPFLAGRIWIESEIDFETGELIDDEKFAAEIGEQPWEPQRAWLRLAKYPITLAEFNFLKATQVFLPKCPPHLRHSLLSASAL